MPSTGALLQEEGRASRGRSESHDPRSRGKRLTASPGEEQSLAPADPAAVLPSAEGRCAHEVGPLQDLAGSRGPCRSEDPIEALRGPESDRRSRVRSGAETGARRELLPRPLRAGGAGRGRGERGLGRRLSHRGREFVVVVVPHRASLRPVEPAPRSRGDGEAATKPPRRAAPTLRPLLRRWAGSVPASSRPPPPCGSAWCRRRPPSSAF